MIEKFLRPACILSLISFAACAEFSEVVRYTPRPSGLDNPYRIDERVDARVKTPPLGNHIYLVQEGDTLPRVAQKFHVPEAQIAQANLLDATAALTPGQRLVIPDEAFQNPAEVVGKINEAQEKVDDQTEPSDQQPPEKGESPKSFEKPAKEQKFIWPVSGIVTSPFGQRRGRDHDGIDISAPGGTPVEAAADGDVIFAGRINGYGSIVILKHAGNFFTAYAHLSQYQARKGGHVKQGQVIGRVGRTGRVIRSRRSGHASGYHLHFEIRRNTRSRDPLQYLPKIGKQEPRTAGKK